MRHKRKYRKLNRPTDQRLRLLSNLAIALFTYDKIKTTVPKAKEVKKIADRFVMWSRQGTVAAKRRLVSFVGTKAKVKMIVDKSLQRFEGRKSGFTRMVRAGYRRGDGAELAYLELI